MEQIGEIIRLGALKPLCDLLVVKETKIVTVILDAVLNVLHVSISSNFSAYSDQVHSLYRLQLR